MLCIEHDGETPKKEAGVGGNLISCLLGLIDGETYINK